MKFRLLEPLMTERLRRQWAACEAESLGRGGVTLVAQATGLSRTTIWAGRRELRRRADRPQDDLTPERVRAPGGGRHLAERDDPALPVALRDLVESSTRGDPQSPLFWTSKSTRTLAEELCSQGHPVSHQTVAALLADWGYSLQANRKTKEGQDHPDRDAQFEHINRRVREFQRARQPVVSVDAKKKELVGDYKNGGREWRPRGTPEEVKVYDFQDKKLGKAIPYGVYDLGANTGWVSVGTDHDTAAFAVATLRHWWERVGRVVYPDATRLLVTADAGGSNGYRLRMWKTELARFAADTGLAVTICHLPPGTSKWNRIEHRLFSHISMNWRGRPLESHEAVVELIGATTTRTGLTVRAELDPGAYPKGTKVADNELAAVPIHRHEFHGEWNYTIASDLLSQPP
jgi:hypothetical protein